MPAITAAIAMGDRTLFKLEYIVRAERANEVDDVYWYQAGFKVPGFKGNRILATKPFKHAYHQGIFMLTVRAIHALLEKYPMLEAARPGIPRNRAQCKLCGEIIWSKHTHDFVSCRCGAIAIDGGYDYVRHIGDHKNFVRVLEPWQTDKIVRKVKK